MLIGLLNAPYVMGWPVGKSQSVDTCASMLRQQEQSIEVTISINRVSK